ncbi:unnamed protein product [Didymodactylos carnosus]|uniref:Protein translocase subunit SecA n=1 Tax=Didymodactylos carnosus TaxID=1234261 RepID=A0A8S2CQ85_9BILA|nr:unnamed protein product [Didymodactylos carnosus]CAF3518907.1 unnamed protein product [Didymodactylos carnosus]
MSKTNRPPFVSTHLIAQMIIVALDAAEGKEIPVEYLDEIRHIAANNSDRSDSRAAKYILCAHAAHHCGFVEPDYFVNLAELLSTDHVIIRQCVMWTFATILPIKNFLSPLLIRLLFNSLKDETLGWSISYLFRKMSENDKYIPMVPDTKWISMPKLLFDQKLSEQVRIMIVHTLSQVFNVRRMVAPFIKHKFEELVMIDDLPKRLFIATVNALHMMAIGGAILEKKTVDRLRQLATNIDAAFIKCIHELLDFLDHKRVLSNAASFMGKSQVKKELTVSQITSISRCEEESSEPTSKALSLDHLLGTVGYLDRTFNAEAQPQTASSGHNQAWYRSTLQEIENLTTLAKTGQLKDQDFTYLLSSFKSTIFLGWTTWNTQSSMHQTIATAFRDAAKAEQAIPLDIIDEMLSRLIDDKENVSGLCSETLLILVKNQQELNDQQMKKVEEALTEANDSAVKQNLIEIYALYISKGYHVKLDLSSLEKSLQDVKTGLTASYLFFKAAAIEKRTFTDQTMRILCQVGMRAEYGIKARDNCLWALAYSIRETKDKQSISSELINDLTEILSSPDTSVKQTAAVALCYYGMDEKIVLSAKVLERLAVLLSEKDQNILDNIVSLYQTMSKKHQIVPVVALENLARLLQHPEFFLRQRVIWTFKHVVDDGQELSMPILDLIDLCLDDQESHIRNPAGRTFITYWQGQLVRNDSETIRRVSARLEKLLMLFQRPYELQVRILALEFLRQLIEKDYDLPESILQLLEMCLYDREAKISIKTIAVVESYSRRRPLRRATIVCLEHLLTTETPILPNIIAILKIIVGSGHILSKKVIDILGQLILKANNPNDIVILLTFADRHQPLPKSIDELLRQIYFAKALKYSTRQSTIHKAVAGLVHLTQQGQQLSLFVLNTLFDLLKSANHQSSLIPIILNVISNGQHINNSEHRALLDRIFLQSGDYPSHDLMLTFTQLSRQNQAIPDNVIDHLEKLLDNPSINLFVIEIYQHLIERRKPLDSSIIRRVLKWFELNLWKDLSMDFRHRLTSFFNALANNRSNDANQTHLPSLLQVQQPTTILRELCLAVHTLAVHRQHLHSTMINTLLQLLDGEIDTDIQEIILKTLKLAQSNSSSQHDDLKEFLHLFGHDPNLDDQSLLKQLRDVVKNGKKLPEAYLTRLSHMLYSCDLNLKREAATILALTLSSGPNLPKKVLDAICLTLLDESISMHTLPLLLSSASTWPSSVIDDLLHLVQHSKQPTIQQRAKQLLITQKERNVKVREFLDNQRLLLSKTQHEDVQKMILSSNINDVHQALKIIRAMIILEKHVPHELLSTIVNQLIKHSNEMIAVLILAFTHDIQFNAKLSQSIENTLPLCQSERMFVLIRIMAEKSIPFQEKTLEILLSQGDSNTVNEPLLCLENIARYQQLPTHFISYFVEQLSQGTDDIVGKSFNILCLQISRGYVKYSQELLQSIPLPSIIDRDRLAKETTVQQCLGTIQTLLFVEYLEPTTFELPATQWSRQSLCIDLFTRCCDQSPNQILNFYHELTQFEIFKKYQLYNDQRDDFLRALIEKQRSYDFNLATINQILIYSKTSTDQAMKLLQSKENNWLFQMRLHFIQTIFNQWSFNTRYSQTVLNHLIERISKEENLPAELIEPFLQFIQTPDNILTILDLVTTYQITGDQLISIFANRKSLDGFESLQKKIELMIINKTLSTCANGSEKQFKSASHDLQVLLENGWRLSKLIDLLHSIKLHQDVSDSLSQFLRSLQILIDYKMNENSLNSLKDIFSHENVQSWSANVHALAIEHCFGSISSEKNLLTLLAEIKRDNPDIDVIRFEKMFAQIDQAYENDSSRFAQNEPIKNWSISEIQAWAIEVLNFQSTNSNRLPLSEILAVIKRAVYLDSHFEPRPIQILAVLIMLDRNEQGGRLLQILTGEGKSTVVSVLAVIKALQGQHVDIVTSAMTLAKRDAQEREKFYKYFKIQVSHNNDETSYVSGPKTCYAANIVYGTSSQFQFDLLRHEFSLLHTRTINNSTGAARRHDVIIIDEVDSMLIDENNTIARLADQLPGMEWLNSSLYGVWRSVEADADVVSNRDLIVKNLKEFLLDSKSQIKIPKHLHRFVIDSLPTWIDHAIRAKVEYRLDHHYMIKPDETRTKRIMPIDFSNTGVIQASTTWSDGLHQFLQIKHGLKMTSLTVTTNYLSNVGLFTRYGTQIYGLTGTIGSKDAQNLLQKIYNVDTISIPPFKEKRHILLDPILTINDDQWLNTIVSNSLNHVRNHRAILIICETRLDAKTITTELQRADPTCSIRLYTDNTDAVESNAVNDKIQPGEVIVATNLAGRGTDLKTSPEVEKHGGLHVCLTFLPNNLRVEEQAFGRTSRQGNRGTSQMILCQDRTLRQLMSNDPALFDTNLTDTSDPMILFRYWRAQAERAHLDRIWTEEISDIKLKDELFKKLCQLLVQLRTSNNDPYRLLSAKEQWGLWLKSMDHATQNRKALQQVIETVGYQYEEMPRDDDSFYHAISHQLEGN